MVVTAPDATASADSTDCPMLPLLTASAEHFGQGVKVLAGRREFERRRLAAARRPAQRKQLYQNQQAAQVAQGPLCWQHPFYMCPEL